MDRHSLSVWLGAVLVILMLPAQSRTQPIANPTESPPRTHDVGLSAMGRVLASRVKQAEEQVAGRTPKDAWSKQVGESHPAYKAAKTHLPPGMGLGIAARSPEEAEADVKAAEALALSRALSISRQSGKPAASAEAQKLLLERDQQVAVINAELSKNREAFASHARAGDESARCRLLDQVLQRHGEQALNRAIPNPSPSMTAAEQQDAQNRYHSFLNQLSEALQAEGGAK